MTDKEKIERMRQALLCAHHSLTLLHGATIPDGGGKADTRYECRVIDGALSISGGVKIENNIHVLRELFETKKV